MQPSSTTPSSPEVKSPCIGVCELDMAEICLGCGRSGEEITVWSRASNATRQAIVERAAERLKRDT